MTDSTTSVDDSDKEQAKEIAAARKQKRKKQKMIAGGVLAVLAILVWYGVQPLKAGTNFGICRTYIETRLKYPESFKITQYDEYGRSLRIFYTYTDPFGGSRSEMAECITSPDTTGGYVMQDIKINRRSIPKVELERFNMTIPGVLAYKPSLVIPRPANGDLESLKRDD